MFYTMFCAKKIRWIWKSGLFTDNHYLMITNIDQNIKHMNVFIPLGKNIFFL